MHLIFLLTTQKQTSERALEFMKQLHHLIIYTYTECLFLTSLMHGFHPSHSALRGRTGFWLVQTQGIVFNLRTSASLN